MDFVEIVTTVEKNRTTKEYDTIVEPDFITFGTNDLMIQGNAFKAAFNEETGMWTTDQGQVIKLIDKMVRDKVKELTAKPHDGSIKGRYLRSFKSKKIVEWNGYLKSIPNRYEELDQRITFASDKIERDNYATKRVDYDLRDGSMDAYLEIMNTLYDQENRDKIEWTIGLIAVGDIKKVQKFAVFYGAPGTGKSTILDLISSLFSGYCISFNAKELTSEKDFKLETFASHPLVAIQHDGDLSRISDNTTLNSLVSHEPMTVNAKYKTPYTDRFYTFLLLGTNHPVKITEDKAGINRRMILIEPTGDKIPSRRFEQLKSQMMFEKGPIVKHCIDKYRQMGPHYYDDYRPFKMIAATNHMFAFVEQELYFDMIEEDGISLSNAWSKYKAFCEDALITYKLDKQKFEMELCNYFDNYIKDGRRKKDGTHVRKFYEGFKADKFQEFKADDTTGQNEEPESWLKFDCTESLFDDVLKNCPAQLANEDGVPSSKWKYVTTLLSSIDTKKTHYVKIPQHIVTIDFDIADSEGNKNFEMNLKEASKWPPTYAELSNGGVGIHLEYYYEGDVNNVSSIYDDKIEIKVFPDDKNGALRRRVSKCNDLPIATISSLPQKGGKTMSVDWEGLKNEKQLRTMILKNLRKEYHAYTKPSMDYIKKLTDDAYNSGIPFDVSDMRTAILYFAMRSSNQKDACVKMVNTMHFKSEDKIETEENFKDQRLVFYDVEVFPNLFIICWKFAGYPTIFRMINPSPEEVSKLFELKLIGFYNRKYDNHIIWARSLGYTNEQLFKLSQRIISSHDMKASFMQAYNISYTDIYDFCSKKQSLKKWEIELGIHHVELNFPWDKPVDEKYWDVVADYCANDVEATEAVFNARHEDFAVREMLAKLSGLTVNHTTRQHTTQIIFGDDKNPELNWTDLSELFPGYEFVRGEDGKMHNMYLGEDASFGGYVYAEPGIYYNVALLDVNSLHPTSTVLLRYLGKYTERLEEMLSARLAVKHHDYETARTKLGGALAPYLTDDDSADKLAQALKIVINSLYGYTSATFDNPFKDPRNVNNIVALRGALFMMTLKHEVQKRGFVVAHIKTDSIKIPDATPEIIQFCMDFANQYGYTFEHEATYEKMCLVNDAVYIAKYKDPVGKQEKHNGWTATGTQFQVPYVFKTLFSGEPIEFEDLCETKSVSKGSIFLDMNEGLDEDKHEYKFVGRVGQFTPVVQNAGGGLLVREATDKNGGIKYNSVTGSKGYRWLESSAIKARDMEDKINMEYYHALVDEAIDAINQYGDVDLFRYGVPSFVNVPDDADDEIPFADSYVVKR